MTCYCTSGQTVMSKCVTNLKVKKKKRNLSSGVKIKMSALLFFPPSLSYEVNLDKNKRKPMLMTCFCGSGHM